MKRFLIVALLLVLCTGSAWGQSPPPPTQCSDSSQLMFQLSDEVNGHVALPGESSFEIAVCYEDFFNGESYEGENPLECLGGNLLFNISEADNGHAEFNGAYFQIPVCYGDLTECVIVSDQNACSVLRGEAGSNYRGATIATFIDGEGNSHIAYGDRQTPGTDLVLCCLGEDPICNNDGDCDLGDGETWFNCRDDCKESPPCDIDGVKKDWEECDCGGDGECGTSDDSDTTMCSDLDPQYAGGSLYCTDSCTYEIRSCQVDDTVNPDNALCNNNPLIIAGSGSEPDVEILTCDGINDMAGNNDEKEIYCNVCANNANYDLEGPDKICVWDDTDNICYTDNIFPDGTQCRQVIVGEESSCADGATSKSIMVEYEKIAGPGTCPTDGTITVPCARTVQLPFFGAFQFLLSLLLIGAIYLALYRNRQ